MSECAEARRGPTQFDPVVLRLIDLLKQALPGRFPTGGLMLTLARSRRIDKISGGVCKSEDSAAVKERMAAFMAICKSRKKKDGK